MFTEQLGQIRNNAVEYITSVLQQRGTNYELISPDEYEDEISDEVHKLPRAFNVSKQGYYCEFSIIVINIDADNNIQFNGLSIEDNEEELFSMDDLFTDTIVLIAELVYKLEN